MKIICGVENDSDDTAALITDVIQSLHNDVLHPDCSVHFKMPQDIKFITQSTCDASKVSHCPEKYKLINGIYDDINKACESDFHAGVVAEVGKDIYRVFKNVFCAMCHNQTVVDTMKCFGTTEDPNKPEMPTTTFTMLFVTGKIKSYRESVIPQTSQRQVCVTRNGELNLETCRPLLCPWGRVIGENGTCEWVSRFITVGRILVTLKLTPTFELTETGLRSTDFDLLSINGSWPEGWKLYIIEYTLNVTLVKQIFISIGIVGHQSNVRDVLVMIEEYSVSDWSIQVNGYWVSFTSEISETRSPHTGNPDVYKFWNTIPTDNLATVTISTIHFCQHVQLRVGEFIHESERNRIVSMVTDRHYDKGEFMLITDTHNKVLPRICLEGSGFDEMASNTDLPRLKFTRFYMILLLVFKMIRYVHEFNI